MLFCSSFDPQVEVFKLEMDGAFEAITTNSSGRFLSITSGMSGDYAAALLGVLYRRTGIDNILGVLGKKLLLLVKHIAAVLRPGCRLSFVGPYERTTLVVRGTPTPTQIWMEEAGFSFFSFDTVRQ